jgi:hypothetical protein
VISRSMIGSARGNPARARAGLRRRIPDLASVFTGGLRPGEAVVASWEESSIPTSYSVPGAIVLSEILAPGGGPRAVWGRRTAARGQRGLRRPEAAGTLTRLHSTSGLVACCAG